MSTSLFADAEHLSLKRFASGVSPRRGKEREPSRKKNKKTRGKNMDNGKEELAEEHRGEEAYFIIGVGGGVRYWERNSTIGKKKLWVRT